ncbi:myelin expression factor 2-like isoform X1 [Maniola jurtina]|uniref:myelin expression factor 2-like isoform X1 n=1 Tax=Maniola jurtina TaxID=191418 RepID=UPI001E6873AF|nr:myelin expression factor 2-like isoform X1 [Maniola jurtina]XP_045775949.1 myelin expression factor 2-like isoform X1 [Maniola jurtina]XP_045775950.1 myelin expression factor 2-like isoform X1 [Maniola jurtina]
MDNQREKERDRSRRGDRPSRFSDATRDRSGDRERSEGKRLFVSNIPYEFRWAELKDLFKDKVGDVAYVELFNDENGKPRGCGVVEFTNSEAMKKALFVMHRYELNGRKLVLKEETGNERNRLNNPRQGGGVGGGGRNMRDDKDGWGVNKPREPENYNTYGLSLQFLESINVQPPLVKKVFVANLDYKADRTKIKEIFKMAGKVRNIDLAVDKDGNSRGFAVIEYDHPVEAVQAISMFDKQILFERRMTVRMDRGTTDKGELRLPEGLKGIGIGLGPNGEPLRDVARNLPQNTTPNTLNLASAGSSIGAGVLGAVPTGGVGLNGLGSGLSANTLTTNAALSSSLGLQALGLTGLGALQNQLLQQGLTANDLATVLSQAQVANTNALGLNTGDGMGNVLGNNSLSNNVLGVGPNASMSSGPLSGTNRQLGGASVSGQGFGRDSGQGFGRDSGQQQNNNRDKQTSDMVVITNLPQTVTWQLIREKFSECGDVKFAEMTAPDTAIVRFHKEWDAERAVKMFDRTRIDGRTIDVRFF